MTYSSALLPLKIFLRSSPKTSRNWAKSSIEKYMQKILIEKISMTDMVLCNGSDVGGEGRISRGHTKQRKTSVRQLLWGFLPLAVKLTVKSYISVDLRQSAPTQLWLVQTSSNWFSPVWCAWQIGIAWLVTSLLLWTLTRGLCNSDLSGLKLPVILPSHTLNYGVQKWEKCINYFGSRPFMFRTWIVRFGHPVWVRKLTDIVTNLHSVFMNCT